MTFVVKILISMGVKTITSELIEWVMLECAMILSKRRRTRYDIRLVNQLQSLLRK